LLTNCYSSVSSISLDARIGCGYFSTTGYCNSPPSTGLDAKIDCNCSSTTGSSLISISSFEFEIKITYGVGFAIEVVVIFRKFNVASNSSSNSLFIWSY
jgi:hypothetical protein